MKNENEIMLAEWLQYAKDDLESAEVVLKKTESYHISVYHSHQALEKIFKWFLLKDRQKFPFTHDLRVLLKTVGHPEANRRLPIVTLVQVQPPPT